MGGGIKAFTQGSGGMIKRLHAGRAAEAGVLAAELTSRGFTAPKDAIDGNFGMLQAIGGDDADPLTDGGNADSEHEGHHGRRKGCDGTAHDSIIGRGGRACQ